VLNHLVADQPASSNPLQTCFTRVNFHDKGPETPSLSGDGCRCHHFVQWDDTGTPLRSSSHLLQQHTKKVTGRCPDINDSKSQFSVVLPRGRSRISQGGGTSEASTYISCGRDTALQGGLLEHCKWETVFYDIIGL